MAGNVRYRSLQVSPDVLSCKTPVSISSLTDTPPGTDKATVTTVRAAAIGSTGGKRLIFTGRASPLSSKSPRSSPTTNNNRAALSGAGVLRNSSLSLSGMVYTLLFLSLLVTVLLLHTSVASNNNNKSKNSPAHTSKESVPYGVNQMLRKASMDLQQQLHQQQQQLQQQQQRLDDGSVQHQHQPRILFLDGPAAWDLQHFEPRQFLPVSIDDDDEDNDNLSKRGIVQDDWQPHHHDNNNDNTQQCLPKASWQTQSYPNCNSIHEIYVASAAAAAHTNDKDAADNEESMSVLGEGWFRTTWRFDRPTTSTTTSTTNVESVVLKTLRIQREFLSEYYELHRRDAVAMERLTASSFVVDIFAYCGQSAINEMADFPLPGVQNLEQFNRRMRGQEHSEKVNTIKLRLAASIAVGLADIHAGGGHDHGDAEDEDDDDEQVYMAHYDLNPRNIALFAGGRPKINDFNIAEFLRYNPATNQTCKFPSRLHEPWWRAPEEMNTTHTLYVDEKVDVYALGNILFHTLTTHSAHGKQHAERMPEVRPLVAANVRPEIPAIFRNSIDPNVQAILQAIKLCWRTDPTERGTAEEVAAILYEALLKSHNDAEVTSDVEPPPVNNSATANDDDDDENESGEDEIEDKHAMGHVVANVASTAAAAAL